MTKKHSLNGWKTWHVLPPTCWSLGWRWTNIHVQSRQLFVDSICFQQNIHRKTLRRISGVVKLQRIIHKNKCAVSEREILLKIEKNKRWAERADQKHVNNLTFDTTVCFNGCQTSNVCRQNTSCLSCVDCKTVGFFLKISKEIGKVWRKSLTRAGVWGVFLPSLPSLALCFQPHSRPFVWLLARTWIRKNTDCFAV